MKRNWNEEIDTLARWTSLQSPSPLKTQLWCVSSESEQKTAIVEEWAGQADSTGHDWDETPRLFASRKAMGRSCTSTVHCAKHEKLRCCSPLKTQELHTQPPVALFSIQWNTLPRASPPHEPATMSNSQLQEVVSFGLPHHVAA